MNVRELIEELSNYGDHLSVEIVVNMGEDDKRFAVDEVTTRERSDGPVVTFEVDLSYPR